VGADPLEQARTAFLAGLGHFEQHRLNEAEACFAQALALAPGRLSVLLNLGVTRAQLGRFADATEPLQAALAQDPGATDAWAALALCQVGLGQWADAANSHEELFALGQEGAELRRQHAQCLTQLGRYPDAVKALQQALALDDTFAPAWSQLGGLWREMGDHVQAIHCYQRALDCGADPELHHYFLSALQAEPAQPQPPRQYVQALFDQYADDFDHHLVDQLGYQGHQVLVDMLPVHCPARFERVLDLGCGTGLCGAALRPRAVYLEGVDLAPAMVDKARQRGVYDALAVADIHDHLASTPGPFDLVLAADVFIYVGALDKVFALLAERVRPRGWVGFTVERARAGQTVTLLPSLRYAHADAYLDHLARQNGFDVAHRYTAPIRHDQRRPVMGEYVYLQKR
jgi:predicted TPR repeat methyltransferase